MPACNGVVRLVAASDSLLPEVLNPGVALHPAVVVQRRETVELRRGSPRFAGSKAP
ncbi:hypothetical protein [Haloactinopolyspora alba]|uniref:hypothetical protein n=1 Tax=Haloactinopolyspora alba TaxID=648780 RepID=UPI0013ECB022|nr:hypothetical protein [Haloactinopolyspora alba]